MRYKLVAILSLVACSASSAGALAAQAPCGTLASPAQRAANALDRMVGTVPIDSTRRALALALIERAMNDTHFIAATTSARAAADSVRPTAPPNEVRARLARMYAELAELLRPDIDLSHLARADAPPRYLTVTRVCYRA